MLSVRTTAAGERDDSRDALGIEQGTEPPHAR
ncbi:hypothetical protein ENSA7_72610 [Enhygromyxa salina]|uniref:Uncharacterized protein n=1 Tax=Enhygromyxa salina TaxID=215803 RepID=A0A2S9XUA6_9BACT|nr:hypothetical protein ENSA7_72610 [Enhygromyxa salina]